MPHPYLVGDPCEVALGEPPNMYRCGYPSLFIYYGFVPEGMKPKVADKRGWPTTLLMCPDHAKSLASDFAWHIRDGKTRIERLDTVRHRLHCSSCGINVIVQWATDDTAPTNPGDFEYCPRCGTKTYRLFRIDAELDYWELMSEALDHMPIQLVKMLYNEWDRRRYQRFFDYAHAQVQAFDTTGDMIPELESA